MSSLRKTYDEYLGHIVLNMMADSAVTIFTLSDIENILGEIAADDSGMHLFPDADIAIALEQLVAADILHHDAPHYVITTKTVTFCDEQHILEGSVMWKCKTIGGYAPLVLKAMHDKKMAGFTDT